MHVNESRILAMALLICLLGGSLAIAVPKKILPY